MIGVERYSDAAIRAVLDEYGAGGLHEWLWIDTEKADAEGRDADLENDSGLMTRCNIGVRCRARCCLTGGWTTASWTTRSGLPGRGVAGG